MGFISLTALMAGAMHVPMFPEMAKEFDTSATLMKLSVSATFLGAGVGQMFAGPFSDAFGKRRILTTFCFLYALGSLLCAFSTDINMFLSCRFIQGLGIAGAPPIVRALVSEDFSDRTYYRVMATIILLFSISPGVAPILGSFIGHHLGWQEIFYTLFLFAIVSLVITATYRFELKPSEEKLSTIYKNALKLLGHKRFMAFNLLNAVTFAQLFIFTTLSSFLFRQVFGWSIREFAWVGTALVLGSAGGSLLTRFLVSHLEPKLVLPWGIGIMLTTSLMLFGLEIAGLTSGRLVLTVAVVYFMGTGVTCSVSTGKALECIKHFKGVASGIIGVSAVLGVSLGTALASIIDDNLSNISFILLSAPLIGISIMVLERFSKQGTSE